MKSLKKMTMFLATGFYSGNSPVIPGTVGTVAAIPFVLAFNIIPLSFHALYCVGFILIAIVIADKAEALIGEKDPGCIVIDEIAGFVISFSLVPVGIYSLIAGFLLFRFFDIVKPGPVRYFERHFSAGPAIVLDDIMAGFFTAVLLKIMDLSGLF